MYILLLNAVYKLNKIYIIDVVWAKTFFYKCMLCYLYLPNNLF